MTTEAKTALIVLTSVGEFPASAGEHAGRMTGFYMDEMTTPYWALRDAGISIEFASIAGGKPPSDPASMGKEDNRKPSVQRFLDDEMAMNALRNSTAIKDVDAEIYDLIFLPGGHGTMWDFRQSDDLARIVGRMFDRGAIIGAVCHGPAGLIEAKAADGSSIVKGRRINSFTDAEERAVNLADTVPFLLENMLREKGANFESSPNFTSHAVRDGNLVTGQNPASIQSVAELLVEAVIGSASKLA